MAVCETKEISGGGVSQERKTSNLGCQRSQRVVKLGLRENL